MRRRALLLLLLALFLAPQLVAPPRAFAENEDEELVPGLRLAPRALAAFLERLRPEEVQKADKYFDEVLKSEIDKLPDDAKLDIHDPKYRSVTEKVIELYHRGGFEAVKALAKDGTIPAKASARIAQVRDLMVQDAISKLAGKYGEVRVNDFSTAPTAQSDIDQTFHPVNEVDPETGKTRPKTDPLTGEKITGIFLKKEFNAVFKDLFGIHPEKMECSSHAAEASVPDWRQHPDTAEFELKLAVGLAELRQNPEAYFLEGAFRRQVDRRSFESNEPLFRIFRPLRTHAGETDQVIVKRPRGPAVEVERTLARYEVYRNTPPEWRKGYAFGAAVGNLLFFQHHSGENEVAERAKYLMRSIEDGMGSLLVDSDGKGKLYFNLNREQRRAMLKKLYPDAKGAKFRELFHMYQMADKLRTRRTELSSPQVQKEIYTPILKEILAEEVEIFRKRNQPIPDCQPKSVADIPADRLEGYLKDAGERFRKRSHAMLMDNCVRAAGPRIRDWLDPSRIDPEKIPPRHREAFKQDPEKFRKNLRNAAMSEIRDCFSVLEPETVDRIIQAEPDSQARKQLASLKQEAEVRRGLFGSGHAEGHFAGLRNHVREIAACYLTFGPDLKRAWNDGEYTRSERFFRMKDIVAERLGYRNEGDYQRLNAEADGSDPKSGGSKVLGKIFNLGNADSAIALIRAGQESGWDWKAVGYAGFMEVVSNCPGVAPVLAIKGALVDGQFEGAAVLVAGAIWPGVGQAYMIYNIGKGAIEIIDFEISSGISDLIYMGYSPDEPGIMGFLRRYSPGRLTQDFIVSRAYAAPPTLLHFVPGGGFQRKRLNMFSYFDPRLTAGLRRQGIAEKDLDPHRRRLAEPFFRKWVNDYCDLRPGTPFGDDPAIRRRFEEIENGTGGWMLDSYLDRPSIREGLRNRLVTDYLAGLQRYRLEEGQKKMDEMGANAEETAELLHRLDEGFKTLGAESKKYLPLVSGLPDWPTFDEAAIEKGLTLDTESEPEVKIVVPEGPLTVGDIETLRGEVYAPPGRFQKPYDYDWTIEGLGDHEEGGPYKGLSFLKGRLTAPRVRVTLKVTGAAGNGEVIGQDTKVLEFGKEREGDATSGGALNLIRIVVVRYSSEGKQQGDNLKKVTETIHYPALVSPVRSLEEALEDARKNARSRFGEPAGDDWRSKLGYGGSVVVSITVTAAGGPTGPSGRPQVPPPAKKVEENGGPEW